MSGDDRSRLRATVANSDASPQTSQGLEPAEAEQAHKCALCGENAPFDLPEMIVQAALSQNVVIFAGAGASTEVPAVFPKTLYLELAETLPELPPDASFPAVMSAFEKRYGRRELLRQIKLRLDAVDSFPYLRLMATRFHLELATMPYLAEIVTTNWDLYFEEACGAIPIVLSEDYAFHDFPGRKVYKIHGSIATLSSVVATEEDYRRNLEALRSSALGGTLRHILATKLVIFVGYSLEDEDFLAVYRALTGDMGELRPTVFVVSPFASNRANELGFYQVLTDGTYFLHKLKETVVSRGCYLADSVFSRVPPLLSRVTEAHLEVSGGLPHAKFPGVVFCLSYQDGLVDALTRMEARLHTGEYSDLHRLQVVVRQYEEYYERAMQRGLYWDAAYIRGYSNGLVALLVQEEDLPALPLFFLFTDRELTSVAEVRGAARGLARRKDKSLATAAQKVSGETGPSLVPQHTPFLYGVLDPRPPVPLPEAH